jgi:hypothetical protein
MHANVAFAEQRREMNEFIAIILICQVSLPPDRCTEDTARDVMSIRVDNELGCTSGWQDVVARTAFADDIGVGSYVKTLCRRAADEEPAHAAGLQHFFKAFRS